MMDVGFVGNSQRTDKIFGEQLQSLQPKQLRPTTENALIQLTHKRSHELVRLHTDKSSSQFTFVKEKRGVSIYEGTNHKNQFMVKGETTVRASIEDVLGTFKMGNTHEFDSTLHKLFDLYANKGATLAYVTNQPISVHWMALNTDKIETRDIVFASFAQLYEQTASGGLVALDNHSDGAIAAGSLVWESVDVAKDIPLLRQKHTGCSRYFMRSCGFYVEQTNDMDVSRVSFVISLENETGYVRGSKWMHGLVLCVANLSRAMRKIELISKSLWKESEHCVLCRKTFRAFRRRHHCRLCGHSVCRECSKTLHLDGPVMEQGQLVQMSSIRSCTKCYDQTSTQSSRSLSQRSSSEYSSSRNMSFDEPKMPQSIRSVGSSASSITKSYEHSHMSTSQRSDGISSRQTASSSTISMDQLHSIDDLMAKTSSHQSLTSFIQPAPSSASDESMFFVIPNEGRPAPQEEDNLRDSYNTLDDRSSGSIVYDVDDAEGGFDISDKKPQPDPEPAFKVFEAAPPQIALPKTHVMKGDMILLQ